MNLGCAYNIPQLPILNKPLDKGTNKLTSTFEGKGSRVLIDPNQSSRGRIQKQRNVSNTFYVHTNLRLFVKKSNEYKEENTKMWDSGGDAWESFDGVGTLEVAHLSLDELNL